MSKQGCGYFSVCAEYMIAIYPSLCGGSGTLLFAVPQLAVWQWLPGRSALQAVHSCEMQPACLTLWVLL